MRGSHFNIPKAIFYLLEEDYSPGLHQILLARATQRDQDAAVQCTAFMAAVATAALWGLTGFCAQRPADDDHAFCHVMLIVMAMTHSSQKDRLDSVTERLAHLGNDEP